MLTLNQRVSISVVQMDCTELRVELCVQSHGPLVESVSALYKWSTGRPSVGAVQMAYW